MPIETTANLGEFFTHKLEQACKNQEVHSSHEVRNYIATLLCNFANPMTLQELTAILDQSVALLLDQALQLPPTERFERLKNLGDNTLYIAGFFSDHLEARGINEQFVASIGGFAYRTAGSMLVRTSYTSISTAHIFSELSASFTQLMRVLAEISATLMVHTTTSSDILKMYEKWVRTQSLQLAHKLAAVGVTPIRKVGVA